MTFTQGPVLVGIQQPSTAKSKSYVVKCGFRPAMIQWWQCNSNGDMTPGVWLDGSTDGTRPTQGAFSGTALADIYNASSERGITVRDDGFEFGQDDAFKVDGVRLWFLIHRTTYPIQVFSLDDVPVLNHEYGSGNVFKTDSYSGDTVEVYSKT